VPYYSPEQLDELAAGVWRVDIAARLNPPQFTEALAWITQGRTV
jgi:hypothetical protein